MMHVHVTDGTLLTVVPMCHKEPGATVRRMRMLAPCAPRPLQRGRVSMQRLVEMRESAQAC